MTKKKKNKLEIKFENELNLEFEYEKIKGRYNKILFYNAKWDILIKPKDIVYFVAGVLLFFVNDWYVPVMYWLLLSAMLDHQAKIYKLLNYINNLK